MNETLNELICNALKRNEAKVLKSAIFWVINMSKDLSKSRKPKGRKSVAPYIHYSCNTFCRCTPICQYVQERKRRVLRQDCSFCANISLSEKKIKPICLRLFDHTNEMK